MKKTLCIFLIFFLLFGFTVPAFADEIPIPPSNVEGIQYDSYIVTVMDSFYYCILYDSLYWSPIVNERELTNSSGNKYHTVHLVSLSDSSPTPYTDLVEKSYYDVSSGNNGWGDFNASTVHSFSFNDGSPYYTANVNAESVIDSNYSLYYGYLDKDTKELVKTGVFFSPPTLEGVTGEALTQFRTQTTQNLMIIALCGVGCLAFLISLPILRKVLLRFLNR